MPNVQINSPYKGSGSITREQFLFYEMRTTAKLLVEGLDDKEVMKRIVEDNLFQYPTEKSVNQMVRTCLHRLHGLKDEDMVAAIAAQPADVAKQICLYAMMKQYRIMWDFMITVVGEKYRLQDFSFGMMDMNVFFMRIQEQDDYVASWSEATIKKIRQVIVRVLIENEYLDSFKTEKLNPVWLNPILENAIKANSDMEALPAFNCFS